MTLPQYVEWRGGRLWYRRAFPKELWPVVGKGRSFAMSLRTNNPSEATRSRPEAERAYFVAVDKARAELASRVNTPPLTLEAAQSLAVQWFVDTLSEVEGLRGQMAPSEIEAATELASDLAADARQALAEGDAGKWANRAKAIRDQAGYGSEPSADLHLIRLLGRAAVAAEEVEQGRLVGDYGRRPRDPLFASALEAPQPVDPKPVPHTAPAVPQSHTVADLERDFRAAKFPSLSKSTVQGYAPVFRIVADVLGADTPLAAIGHADGIRLFEAITSLPTNSLKRSALAGMDTLQMVAEGKRLGFPTVSPKTINDHYLANVGALFRFAVERGWMATNPVKGLRAHDPVNDRDRRDTFGAKLPVLFGGAPWSTNDRTSPLNYWGPLLALFHGLRLGEVAGLLVRDVGDEAGTAMMFIRDGKRPLKTKSARRDVPVHPLLVQLGFVEFAKARREEADGAALLFAGQKAYARDQWGRGLGEWFVKQVKARELEGRKLTFHSLRHDFRDALREAEVPSELANYLMGHAQEGMGAIYGGRPALARLSGAIGKVAYAGVIIGS